MEHFLKETKNNLKEMTRELYYRFVRVLFYAFLAVLIGVAVGVIATIFGQGLYLINAFREIHPKLIFTLPFSGLLMIWVYLRYGRKVLGGMGLIFRSAEEGSDIPFRLVPLAIFGTWLTHLSGGSAGREGVAVQIGATIASRFARFLPEDAHRHILLLTGVAAGFGGLFGTPVAGTMFALELLVVGKLYYEALVPALIGGFVASFTSAFLGLPHMKVALSNFPLLLPKSIAIILGLGFLFGLVGRSFSWSIFHLRLYFAHLIEKPLYRIAILGAFLAIGLYLFGEGRYSGLGETLFMASFKEDTVYWYDSMAKFIFTVLTLSIGFQGGELTPLFVIGATLGATLGVLVGLPPAFVAALGAIAVFGSATHTFLTPIFIGVEIFGTEGIIFFFAVSVASFVMSGRESIYQNQKDLRNLLLSKE